MKTKTKTKTQTPGQCSACSNCPVKGIEHAPWNPRTPEELKASHPEMQKLVDSVKSLGVVQPIAVWRRDDDSLLCIAGNRRLEAAKLVGRETVPALVYTDLTEADARAITRAENEVRFGVSPLMDAKLVAELKELGRSQAEIAAVFGVSEARICRRAKLLELSDETLKFFEGKKYEVTALEFLADKSQGDAALQKTILHNLGWYGDCVDIGNMRSAYIRATSLVDFEYSKVFTTPGGEERKRRCQTCALCTGNQPDLFGDTHDGDMGEDDARCLNPSCMKKMVEEAKNAALVAALEAHGGTAEDVSRVKKIKSWEFKDYGCKKRRSKANSFPYVATTDYDGFEFEVQWGPDPKEAAKAEKAAVAAQKAKDEAERARRAEDEKICDRLAELFDEIRDGFSDTASAEIGEHFLPDGAPERLKTLVANLLTRGLFDSYADEGQEHDDLEELHELLPGLFATVKMVDAGKEFAELFEKLRG